MLAKRLKCFTHPEASLILDPFAGVGSTLLELGKGRFRSRSTVAYAICRANCIHTADCRELYRYVSPNSVDMVVTSPPYWDILLQKRTADNKEQRDYGEASADLGKIQNYEKFLLELRKIFGQVYNAMKPKSYCCVIVMDLRKKNRFYPYHIDISQFMQEIGFIFDDLMIWNRGQEYNNLRPLGYPSVFRVNKVHEFILIFQKPQDGGSIQ